MGVELMFPIGCVKKEKGMLLLLCQKVKDIKYSDIKPQNQKKKPLKKFVKATMEVISMQNLKVKY